MTEKVNTPILVELQSVNGEAKPATTSLRVAEYFEKNHRDVLRGIREVLDKTSSEFGQRNFAQSSYTNEQGKEQPMYLLTRDGFMIVAMSYTGEKAMQLKEAYINAFNEMERKLSNEAPQTYLEALKALVASEEAKLEAQKALAIEQEAHGFTKETLHLTEAQRDKAVREKAWIGTKREATAMQTASLATRRANNWKASTGYLADVAEHQQDTIDELNDRLGQGQTWRQTKAIDWLPEVFVPSKAMYQQVGKTLTKLGRSMGMPPQVMPDSEYGEIKLHHVRVIETLYHKLMADPRMMQGYRR